MEKTLKKRLFFDGFITDDAIDAEESSVKIFNAAKKITTHYLRYIEQTDFKYFYDLGSVANYDAKLAQTFVLDRDVILTNIWVYLSKYGDPSDGVKCSVYNVEGGIPTTLVATATNTVPASSLGINASLYNFLFSNLILTLGTYAIVLERTTTTTGNSAYYKVHRTDKDSAYPEGVSLRYNRHASTWTTELYDLYFALDVILLPKDLVYQSKEQVFSQDINSATLYVTHRTMSGTVNVDAEIAIYSNSPVFVPMTLEEIRDVSGDYKESKFTYNGGASGNKVIVRLYINRNSPTDECDIYQYGVILGGDN